MLILYFYRVYSTKIKLALLFVRKYVILTIRVNQKNSRKNQKNYKGSASMTTYHGSKNVVEYQSSFHTISALDTLKVIGSEVAYGEKK